jgi:CheY-like chemotaxis protein
VSDYNLGEGEPTGLEVIGFLEGRLGRPVPAVLLTAVAADLIEHAYEKARAEHRAMPSVMPGILQKPAEAAALNAALARAIAAQKGRETGHGNA